MTPGGLPLTQAVADMLAALRHYLTPQVPPLPPPTLSTAGVSTRPIGLGNWRGYETRGGQPVVAVKGGRLDARVRFQLWAADVTAADTAVAGLQARVLAAFNTTLRGAGFLDVDLDDIPPAESVAGLNAWRAFASFRVLYEFNYTDTEEAASVLWQIPIDINSQFGESTVVTDEMVRWDGLAAPALTVRGGAGPVRTVRAVAFLASLPGGWGGDPVTVQVSVGGGAALWPAASLQAFLSAFAPEPGTFVLGGQPYHSGRLDFPNPHFPNPITLVSGADSFQIVYAKPALLAGAVVYLRVLQ